MKITAEQARRAANAILKDPSKYEWYFGMSCACGYLTKEVAGEKSDWEPEIWQKVNRNPYLPNISGLARMDSSNFKGTTPERGAEVLLQLAEAIERWGTNLSSKLETYHEVDLDPEYEVWLQTRLGTLAEI